MKRIGVLTYADLMPDSKVATGLENQRDEQARKLIPAFASKGLKLEFVDWRNAPKVASQFDAMLPLFVWDYFAGNEESFITAMDQVSSQTVLLNDLETLKWNSVKTYLDELSLAGAPTIETLLVDRVTREAVQSAFEALNCDRLVIKPQVGGGAWRQVLHSKSDPFPSAEKLPPAEALIQPFLPTVQSEGEFSFLFFGGEFSHGLIKRPKQGDYRIQTIHGGKEEKYTPSVTELESAESVLRSLKFPMPLYARVDLLRGRDGNLKLIELELIEPYFYLAFSSGDGANNEGALQLANALVKRLS